MSENLREQRKIKEILKSISTKLVINSFAMPEDIDNSTILSMTTSKKYIFLFTDSANLYRIENDSLKLLPPCPIQIAETKSNYKENLTKMWTERSGNHCIIRHNGVIYYFNNSVSSTKELKKLRDIDVCAVAFNDKNDDLKNTGNILVSDYYNNIYEYNIILDRVDSNGAIHLKEQIEKVTTISFKATEKDEEKIFSKKAAFDRIYDIKFYKSIIGNSYYIICVTKYRFYQFRGSGTNFKEFFERYEEIPSLFNDSCKFFPYIKKKLKFLNGTDLDIIYQTKEININDKKCNIELYDQFGWKTETGYCFGKFIYNKKKKSDIPEELKNFNVVPFTKIIYPKENNNEYKPEKIVGIEPLDIVQTKEHIFFLYSDCISIINKITFNIEPSFHYDINYNINFDKMIYNGFHKNNGFILLYSQSGLYQIPLKDENNNIWKDYLDVGNYKKSKELTQSKKNKLRINRIIAEEQFNKRIEFVEKERAEKLEIQKERKKEEERLEKEEKEKERIEREKKEKESNENYENNEIINDVEKNEIKEIRKNNETNKKKLKKIKKEKTKEDIEEEKKKLKNKIKTAIKFVNSDEKFENISLKFLMNDDLDGLREYLKIYIKANEKNENNQQLTLLQKLQLRYTCTLAIEIFINKAIIEELEKKEVGEEEEEEKEESDEENDDQKEYKDEDEDEEEEEEDEEKEGKEKKKKRKIKKDKFNLREFRGLVRGYKAYIDKDIIYSLLQTYGRVEESIEFASIMGDFEKVISTYINQGKISEAADKLTWFSAFCDKQETLDYLSEIFLENCTKFLKHCPKTAISLLQQRFKSIKMEKLVHSLMSTADKDEEEDKNLSEEQKKRNSQTILMYLKSLVEKPKIEEENNIHNLYIFYLSKYKENQFSIIEYLKSFFNENNNNEYSYHKKKKVLFNIDYAKKIFQNNPPAYALVLALSGKQSEGVRTALLEDTEQSHEVAKFIARNSQGETLQKQLWIDIFSYYNKKEFKKALDIMSESKILKIEDVLPYITNTITIDDFKPKVSKCINEYEINIKQLKEDINDFNKISETIKDDIKKYRQQSRDIQFPKCRCVICQQFIKDKDILLFPCGHMFDFNCMRECLLNYESTGLDYIHEKNVQIDEILYKLGYIKERSFSKNNREIQEKENKKQEGKNKSKKADKKQDAPYEKDSFMANILKEKLVEILKEQCVLCGDFMIDSIQIPLKQKEDFKPDINGLILKRPKEFCFI